jgi:hypothetical protein
VHDGQRFFLMVDTDSPHDGQEFSSWWTPILSIMDTPFSPGHSSLPETGAKSAKAISQHHTDQRVTRRRTEGLDCRIGWPRKRNTDGWMRVHDCGQRSLVRTSIMSKSTISPEGHHGHPESIQDRTH